MTSSNWTLHFSHVEQGSNKARGNVSSCGFLSDRPMPEVVAAHVAMARAGSA